MPYPWSTPITLAHHYWELLLQPYDIVIDATCGNGKDTLKLATLVPKGLVIGLDIQKEAIDKTAKITIDHPHVHLFEQSHAEFPPLAYENKIKLIVYNLGYLPGSGNKNLTTFTHSTLISIKNSFNLLDKQGALSITCYPGHLEGQKEEKALLELIPLLSKKEWHVCYHKWVNRPSSPSLLLIQKQIK